jgi:phosphoglycerol transferase MdoB-like AlkP superfamily enzyme
MKININIALILKMLFALLVFTLCRGVFYIYNIDYYPNLSLKTLSKIFYGGLVFDLSGLLYLLILYILTQSLPFKFRHNETYQKITNWLFVIPISLGVILNLMDTLYYQVSLKRTTVAIFAQFSNEKNLSSVFLGFMTRYWYMILLAILLIYGVYFVSKKIKVHQVRIANNYVYFFSSLILVLVYAGLIIGGIRGGFTGSTRPITLSNAMKYTDKPNQMALVLNTPFALLRSVKQKPLQEVHYFDSQAEQEAIYSAFHSGENKPDSLFRKKNVVLFILESFGREHIGAYNTHIADYQGFTPFLDSLMEHSYSFEKAFSNGRKSISGMPSCIASVPSLVEPFILSHYSGNKLSALPTVLKKEGYQTAFFHGGVNGSMGFDAFSVQAGFDKYFGKDEFGNEEAFDGVWGVWDEEFLGYYASELSKMEEPFCTALFSLTSHDPFILPKRYKNTFPKGNLPIQETIGYTDYALRKYFEAASKTAWFENTIFIITADHAATFSDLAEYKTPSGFFAVPFIIYEPGNPARKGYNKTDVVQQIDIMPTVLGLLAYPNDYIAFGQDALDSTQRHFSMGYMAQNYHLFENEQLLQYTGEEISGMYNFVQDPFFKQNNAEKEDSQKEKMLKLSQAFIQEYNRRMIHNQMAQ